MNRIAILILAAMMTASCGGGNSDFTTVGKKIDSNVGKVLTGCSNLDYSVKIFEGKNGKKGCHSSGIIIVPAIFDDIRWLYCQPLLFAVTKNGKTGLMEALEMRYIIPCEYDGIEAGDPSKSLVYVQKGEEYETFSCDTGKPWDGTDNWPPKKFPAEVPFKMAANFPYWKLESITCTRIGSESIFGIGFAFTVKGVGLGDSDEIQPSAKGFTDFYSIYLEDDSGNRFQFPGGRSRRFPGVKQGQPFERTIFTDDSAFEHVKFAGFVFDKFNMYY